MGSGFTHRGNIRKFGLGAEPDDGFVDACLEGEFAGEILWEKGSGGLGGCEGGLSVRREESVAAATKLPRVTWECGSRIRFVIIFYYTIAMSNLSLI